MEKDYFLGLDLGTGSLGWAVTDESYEIIRAHGKALWGVRLFDSAETAEERRNFRTARRRLDRRNWRIELLQGIFSEEINKVDSGFFLRMKESKYVPEDKRDINGKCPELPYVLFVDKDFTDKEYHRNFPTIYHLRQYLMNTDETPDIRLIYLAFHHMMKHRGHFLLPGSIENIKEFNSTFQQFLKCVENEELDFKFNLTEEEIKSVEKILRDKTQTRTAKKTQLIKNLNVKSDCEKALLNLIAGGTVKLSDIFGKRELDNLERSKISFSDNNYDDYAGIVESDLGEQFIIIANAKAVYDWSVLADILGEHQSISGAKVALYEKHKKDLQYLKDLVKENLDAKVYKNIFVKADAKTANYSAYIGMTKVNGKKVPLADKQCSKDDFFKFIRKNVLEALKDLPEAKYLEKELDNGTFLPKQVTKDNGVIPHQIHLYELDRIIENLENRIPLLKEQGDKIRHIFTFRIPYYVGPLNGITKGGQKSNWMTKNEGKESEKIYPWNFHEIVNVGASAEQFIRRMTNKCTYLKHEDVLPKNSLLYSKFMVLNELNNLRLNGELVSVEIKQRIYEELFKKHRKVTQKRLKEYLKITGIIAKDDIDNLDITGIDGDFKTSLTAYHDFKEKLTGCDLRQEDKENIILNITLFGEDKKLLKKRLTVLCPDLTEKQIKGLCMLNYNGWGRLSRAFLEGITAPAPETGEAWTIIRTMWETNDNLMQILSDKYQFTEIVDLENGKDEIKGISYDLVDQLYVSPAVKRQIWQTLQIVKELCKITGMPPKRIFVEMAREKAESKRTESRQKILIDLYKKCKSEERDWVNELENKVDSTSLRSDKLYLYYTQKGRCMYSGEVIELDDLWDNNKYDIDHIYPQSKVMDDSLDNRVLVKKTYNADKSDEYPIKPEIRNKMKSFWKSLLDGGFISKEKYKRLVRSDEFEPAELAGFIERQLVETRQGTKAVASILQQVFPDTEIVYAKAKVTSQFRQEFKLIKVREMNDLHHAKDAYLNIVAGNVYYTKFTKNAAWFIKQNPGRSYNLKKMFTSTDVESNGELAWKAGNNGTIATVKKVMAKNNILVTRRAYEAKGGLFDQQIMKKGKGQVPVKGNDVRLAGEEGIKKYGGYNKATGTYFMLVESEDKKGNKIRTIEFVPLYLCEKISESEKEMLNYLIKYTGLKNPRILIPKIKIDTLFKVDGFYMWLSGRTGKQLIFKGANQLILSAKDTVILKKVIKFVTRRKENKDLMLVQNDELTTLDLQDLYDTFLDKLSDTVYHVRLSAQKETLTKKREKFCTLSNEDKCIVLSEILHMFQCQSGSANLSLIDGSLKAGILVLNNNITNCQQISIINQSPTGIYKKEIDLKGKF